MVDAAEPLNALAPASPSGVSPTQKAGESATPALDDPAAPTGRLLCASDHRLVDAAGVLGLQRSAGNAAVASLLTRPRAPASTVSAGRAAAVQRDGTTATAGPATAGTDGSAGPIGAATALSSAQSIQGAVTARLLKVAGYNAAANTAIAAYRDKRTAYAAAWGAAWERHRGVLAQAKKDADSENLVEGIVIGAVASVVVAAVGAAAFPAAAAAEAFTGTWWVFNAGTAVVSSGAGTGVSSLATASDPGAPAGGKNDATADAWQAVSGVEDAARSVAAIAPRFGLELGNAEYSIAQVQAAIAGSPTDMSWDQTLQMVSTLMNWENTLSPFDSEIDLRLEGMIAFGNAAQAWTTPTADSLEPEIWRAWLSNLTDKDVLGHHLFGNPVHDRLVKLGLLTDSWWVSDADKDKAIADAKAHLASAAPGPPPPS